MLAESCFAVVKRVRYPQHARAPRTLIERLEPRRVLSGANDLAIGLPSMEIDAVDFALLRSGKDIDALSKPIVRPATPTTEVRFEGNIGSGPGSKYEIWWPIELWGTDGFPRVVEAFFTDGVFSVSHVKYYVNLRSTHVPHATKISFDMHEGGKSIGQHEIVEYMSRGKTYTWQINPEVWEWRNVDLDVDGDGIATRISFNFDEVTDYYGAESTLRMRGQNGLPSGVLGAVEFDEDALIGTFTNGEKLVLTPDGPLPLVRTFGPRGVVFSRIELPSPAFAIDSPDRDAETPIL